MAVDNKYGDLEIPGIPDEEPVFVFRAQDVLAPLILGWYRDLRTDAGDQHGSENVEHARRRFLTWKNRKLPD